MEKLIIGSRGSKLALKYAEIAKKAFLRELDIEIEIKKSKYGYLILKFNFGLKACPSK